MCTRQSRNVMWDMINTLFLTLQLPNLLLLLSFSTRSNTSMASDLLPLFQISLKNSELKTTHDIFRGCRVHFMRQPLAFSKQLYILYIYKRVKLTAKTVDEDVVNVRSLEKRSNQLKYKEPKTRSPKTTAKLIQNNMYCFFITIFRLAIPAFFRFTEGWYGQQKYCYEKTIHVVLNQRCRSLWTSRFWSYILVVLVGLITNCVRNYPIKNANIAIINPFRRSLPVWANIGKLPGLVFFKRYNS